MKIPRARPRRGANGPRLIDERDGCLRDSGFASMAASEAEHFERFDALAMELRLTLVAAYDSHIDQVDSCLQRWGLTHGKFNVMMILRDSPTGRLSMSQIAELALTSPRNMTALVDGLADAGLVRRFPSRLDRRVTLIGLSNKGSKLLEEFLPAFYGTLNRYFDGLTETEKLHLLHLLNRLRLEIARVQDKRASDLAS
jgi:DNA-binding MarR family transcriptional regulator